LLDCRPVVLVAPAGQPAPLQHETNIHLLPSADALPSFSAAWRACPRRVDQGPRL